MLQTFARRGVVFLLVVLLFGTLMPGGWKDGAIDRIPLTLNLAALAHVSLFAGMAFLLPLARWWELRWWQLPALGLGLALVTEGLQYFAVDRHPNVAGVVQDLLGTLLGWAAAAAWHGRVRARWGRDGAV
ncbi:hypothetical protein WG922_18350 [Ramlibacter sp. AN1015]|uniref:VanZ family protein n=1 Tax=Ramlibacter sp. AN1015 TaxID=3133428 RepID=UPI0030C438C4